MVSGQASGHSGQDTQDSGDQAPGDTSGASSAQNSFLDPSSLSPYREPGGGGNNMTTYPASHYSSLTDRNSHHHTY